MAESTLAISWLEMQARIGSYLGWGPGVKFNPNLGQAWSALQQFELDGMTASAQRRFYFPQALPGETVPYKWSFLRPTASLSFPQGSQAIPLPDDFGGFEGKITVLTTTSTSQPWLIDWVAEPALRQEYTVYPQMTGPPMRAAQAPLKGTTGVSGQRFELLLFPIADQDYTLRVQYYVTPDYTSLSFPYCLGGAMHAETILESCLSVAEERLDDVPTMQGPHGQAFMARLQASVAIDRSNQPLQFGYNRDRSDDRDSGYFNPHYYAPPATYNGQSFG